MTLGFTGLRWGELVGLETAYVRPASVRVEWQLYELDNGELHRCPPKDESRRTVAAPETGSGAAVRLVARVPRRARAADVSEAA